MQINRQRNEVNAKIVYYGPALSGKTTNLERLHATTNPERRSALTSMKNNEDRTLFFDFTQLELNAGGMKLRFNLYTVPGQPIYEATRKIVLRGADAVVFVADSDPTKLKENISAWAQLRAHLSELGCEPVRFPIIVQFNKRDLRDAVPVPHLRLALNLNGETCIEAQAVNDIGTRETLKSAIRAVLGSNQ